MAPSSTSRFCHIASLARLCLLLLLLGMDVHVSAFVVSAIHPSSSIPITRDRQRSWRSRILHLSISANDSTITKKDQQGRHYDHKHYMYLALELAQEAFNAAEIPVGAVLVSDDGRIVATGRNRVEETGDASTHAEMECLRRAAARQRHEEGHWRMLNCTLYVTLEPCLMCLGAIQSFRVRRVVYGAKNHLLGAIESFIKIPEHKHPFHEVEVVGGVLAEECGILMKEFFVQRRKQAPYKPTSSSHERS